MAALRNRCGHYIFSCGFLYLLLSSFFSSPNLSRRRLDVCHTSHTWCGLSANLGCRSETCCTRVTENTGRKNRQKFDICAPSHNLSGCIFATKAHTDNRKKLLNSSTSSTYLHNMVNFGQQRLRSVGELGASRLISTGFASSQRYCTAFE